MIPGLYDTPWLITPDGYELVRSIAEREDLAEALIAAAKAKDIEREGNWAVELAQGQPLREKGPARRRDGVAIIPIMGPIVRHADMFSEMSGATSISRLGRDLGFALADDDIKAILLSIDSPGGEVNGISEFAAAVRKADARKPVTAYSGGQADSAAFWVAVSAGEFVIHESAETGSLGVVGQYIDRSAMDEKIGVKRIRLRSTQSPMKALERSSPEGTAAWQVQLDEIYDQFESAVSAYTGIDKATIRKDFGQGGTLLGRKAVKVGMARRTGTFEGVLRDLSRGRPRPAPAPAPGKGAQMGLRDAWRKFVASADESDLEELTKEVNGGPKATAKPAPDYVENDTEAVAAMRKRLDEAEDREKAANARASAAEEQSIRARAEAFADSLRTKIVAAERPSVVAAFSLAARDDLQSPVAAGQPSRTDLLAAMYKDRPAHGLYQEALLPEGARTVPGSDQGRGTATTRADKEREEARATVPGYAAKNGAK